MVMCCYFDRAAYSGHGVASARQGGDVDSHEVSDPDRPWHTARSELPPSVARQSLLNFAFANGHVAASVDLLRNTLRMCFEPNQEVIRWRIGHLSTPLVFSELKLPLNGPRPCHCGLAVQLDQPTFILRLVMQPTRFLLLLRRPTFV
jgi:hypothetical protein